MGETIKETLIIFCLKNCHVDIKLQYYCIIVEKIYSMPVHDFNILPNNPYDETAYFFKVNVWFLILNYLHKEEIL